MVQAGYKAGEIIKTINQVTAGRGGGKPDLLKEDVLIAHIWMSYRTNQSAILSFTSNLQ